MAKIKTLHLHERGKERSTAFGKIKFDSNGFAELPDEQAIQLTQASKSLSIVSLDNEPEPEKPVLDKEKTIEPAKTTVEPPKPSDIPEKPASNETKTDDEQADDVSTDDIKSELESMNMKEIREVLIEAGVEADELNKPEFKGKEGKPALIEFAIKILNNK